MDGVSDAESSELMFGDMAKCTARSGRGVEGRDPLVIARGRSSRTSRGRCEAQGEKDIASEPLEETTEALGALAG